MFLVCSEEARSDRGVAGGGQLHLPCHPVQAALPTGEGVSRRAAPHRRGKGKKHTQKHTALINTLVDDISVKISTSLLSLNAASKASGSAYRSPHPFCCHHAAQNLPPPLLQDEEHHEQTTDVRSQLRFFEQLERMEKQRKDEQEREILLKAAKVQNSSSCFTFDSFHVIYLKRFVRCVACVSTSTLSLMCLYLTLRVAPDKKTLSRLV